MFAAHYLHLAFIFVVSLLTVKSISVTGYDSHSCPVSAVIDLTKEKRDHQGSIMKSKDFFRHDWLWYLNGRIFGCMCNVKDCVPLCCPVGYAGSLKGCMKDNFTSKPSLFSHEKSSGNRFIFVNDLCELSWTSHILHRKQYNLLSSETSPDAMIPLETLSFEGFCFFREYDSFEYSVAMCTLSKWNSVRICLIISTIVSLLFTLVTYIVYTVTPKLKNLQGLILRCYLASHIASRLISSIFGNLMLSNGSSLQTTSPNFLISGFGFGYFFTACILWMNVMSIDTWRTFRTVRSTFEVKTEELERAKFVCYSIYVWGSSAVLISFPVFSVISNPINSTRDLILVCWTTSTLLGICICNTYLFVSTALVIRHRRMKAGYTVGDDMDHHHQKNEQWFFGYMKLFMITGGGMIFLAVLRCFESDVLFYMIVSQLEVLQAISIFVIFVWKDDVKRSFCEPLNEIVRRVQGSYF